MVSLLFFFIATLASSPQPIASYTSLYATPSAQIILHTIKLQPLSTYKREMDYKVIKAWIYSINNYFALTGLTDPSQ